MNYEDIQKELRSLEEKLQGDEELSSDELSQIESRVEELEKEQKAVKEAAEKRSVTLEKVKNGLGAEIETAEERKEDESMKEKANYRSVFFKKLLGKELNEEERALSTTVTSVIPVETGDKIFDKMVKLVPLLGEIELFNVPGSMKFSVETTRSDAVKGINAISYVNGTNGVQYSGSTGLSAAQLRTAIGLLPAGYDSGAKFLMNKKTLFNQIMGLQDNAKHDLVRVEGNEYYIAGYPVIISDEVANNTAFLGNFKKYVGNLSSDIEVVKDFDIDSNSYKYLGVAIFDGKPACEDAFIKIATSL